MKQLVIFDLDGTLLDTISDLGAATNHALRHFGYPEHNLASYTKFVGNGITRLIERSLPEDDKTPETVVKVREVFTEYYNEHKTDLTKPYPGIPELLKDLGAMGVKMAVASNK